MLLSVAVSVDGYIDDCAAARFPLSSAEDFDRVDQLRAESDAILVGAETVRRDNPRLLVANPDRRAARVAAGKPAHPLGVTVTASGDLDPALALWHQDAERLVYAADGGHPTASARLGGLAEVVAAGRGSTSPRCSTTWAAAASAG
ncbi:RibD family protein [Actinokineospora soli]|uniref:RibD family protein n=1 Tax=Actinokineospora soli TaxID=1048753 RepID=A0ABW2TT32_9PSEU